jgi:hypothetical protein
MCVYLRAYLCYGLHEVFLSLPRELVFFIKNLGAYLGYLRGYIGPIERLFSETP